MVPVKKLSMLVERRVGQRIKQKWFEFLPQPILNRHREARLFSVDDDRRKEFARYFL